MSFFLRPPSAMAWWLTVAVAVIALSKSGFAQTPARQLGQSSPAFIPSYSLESEKLRRQQQQTPPVFPDHGSAVVPQYDGPYPWWEDAEGVARESANPQRFAIGVSLTAGWEHDDNPFLSPDSSQQGTLQSAGHGGTNSFYVQLPVTLQYEGAHLSVAASYNPEFRTYDSQDIEDAFNQSFGLAATYAASKLTLGLSASFAQTDGTNVEAGQRVDSTTVATSFSASYLISPKTSIGTVLGYTLNSFDEALNSNEDYSAQGFVDYEVTPKTRLGIGAGYSKSVVDFGASSDAVNVSGRVSWRPTEKLAFTGSAGYEWREYEDSTVTVPITTTTIAADGTVVTTTTTNTKTAQGNTQASPIFSLGVLYNITPLATISLDAYRRSNPSVSEINQNYYSTGLVLSASQKLFDRFNVSINTGFENAEYEASVEGVTTNRSDDYWFAGATIACTIRERLTVEIHYRYTKNDSTGGNGVSFGQNVYGASISYHF